MPGSFEERSEGKLRALEEDLEAGRLHHSLLLRGKCLTVLERHALRLCRSILEMSDDAFEHPDLFHLRPSGKSRLITAGHTRTLINDLNRTAYQGEHKVAILHEVDRMNNASANVSLKTLEEPHPGTYLLLITTRPHSLLSTVRSRCLQVTLDEPEEDLADEDWLAWQASYRTWLELVTDRKAILRDRPAPLLAANALVLRFQGILARLANAAWAESRKTLPEGLDEKEVAATEAGIRRGVRIRLLREIEESTRDHTLEIVAGRGESLPGGRLARAVAALEKATGLLEVNLKEETAMEYFLLTSLRVWSGR